MTVPVAETLTPPETASVCLAERVCIPRVSGVVVSDQVPLASTVVVQDEAPSKTVIVFPATPVPVTVTDGPELVGAETDGADGGA